MQKKSFISFPQSKSNSTAYCKSTGVFQSADSLRNSFSHSIQLLSSLFFLFHEQKQFSRVNIQSGKVMCADFFWFGFTHQNRRLYSMLGSKQANSAKESEREHDIFIRCKQHAEAEA